MNTCERCDCPLPPDEFLCVGCDDLLRYSYSLPWVAMLGESIARFVDRAERATLRAEVERLRADLAAEQQRSAGLRLMLHERGTMTMIQYAEKLRTDLEEERLQHSHATAAAAELREVCRKRRRWSALWHREARRLWREVQACECDTPIPVDAEQFIAALGGECVTCGLKMPTEHDACRLSREGSR